MGGRKALYALLGLLLLSIGGGAVIGPALTGSLGFSVGMTGSSAVSLGVPQVVSPDAAETSMPGGYASLSSDGSAIVVGAGLPVGASLRVKLPVTNTANDKVRLKLQVGGLPVGPTASVQGGDLSLSPAARRADANLGRLFYGGVASVQDPTGGAASGNVFALFDGAGDGAVTIHDGQAVVRDLGPLLPWVLHRGVDRIALHWTNTDSRVGYVSFTAYAKNPDDPQYFRVVRARAIPAGLAAGQTSEGFFTDSRQQWRIVISTYDQNRQELSDGSIALTEVDLGSAYDLGVVGCIAPLVVQGDVRMSLERPACHQHTPVRSDTRTDTYYMSSKGLLKVSEGSGPLPDGAVGLWQVTVAPQDGPEFNVVTGTVDLRHTASAATISVLSPFTVQVAPDAWELTLDAGQTGTLSIDVNLPASLPPGFSGLKFSLAPLA